MNDTPRASDDLHFEKSKTSIFVLGTIFICGAIGALLWFGFKWSPFSLDPTMTSTATSTKTLTPTSTPPSTLTPTVASTRTPRPTPTVTPDRRTLNPANQHFYLYVRIQKTWHEAREYCAGLGGHLVTIQAPSENKFVYNLAVSGNTEYGTWLGGTDEEEEGTWKWVTGEDWRYQSWRRNDVETEPDNDFADEIPNADYLRFDGWDSTWKDTHLEEFYFVCEWEP